MGHICIICAISQEIRPILKRFPSGIRCLGDLPVWNFQAFGHRVAVIQSGTGVRKATKAATEAAARGAEIIISAGFCGALTAEIEVGEVFQADKFYCYSSGFITSEITPDQELANKIGTGLKRGTFITTYEIIDKAHICSLLPDPGAINMLEMESSAVAAVCLDKSIRFTAIRSVSDRADQDPGSLFQQICDNEFNVRIAKVASSLMKKPFLLPEYVRLYKNTAIAGETLSEALAVTLERI